MSECVDCRTEDAGPTCRLCSAGVEGQLGTNVLETLTGVAEEQNCKQHCLDTKGCLHYTYHDTTSPLTPLTCFLQSFLLEPLAECAACRSGPGNCADAVCGFLHDDEFSRQRLVVNRSTNPDTVRPVLLGDCGNLSVVTVGPGGRTPCNITAPGGGAGSGYITRASLPAEVLVGASLEFEFTGNRTAVSSDGEEVASAGAGGEPTAEGAGGTGYSGGGGLGDSEGGDGGTAGGNGKPGQDGNGLGGTGSGVDVTQLFFDLR